MLYNKNIYPFWFLARRQLFISSKKRFIITTYFYYSHVCLRKNSIPRSERIVRLLSAVALRGVCPTAQRGGFLSHSRFNQRTILARKNDYHSVNLLQSSNKLDNTKIRFFRVAGVNQKGIVGLTNSVDVRRPASDPGRRPEPKTSERAHLLVLRDRL